MKSQAVEAYDSEVQLVLTPLLMSHIYSFYASLLLLCMRIRLSNQQQRNISINEEFLGLYQILTGTAGSDLLFLQ
ncbi:MAG TPA: hypothetical protein IGS53_14760 [Leptolyngbyaceae cyanobacterium M33_DOE_097]|uniref:Uncharacterized protein n=1 Tax=Oscillatoriales cyanobacterium SpSt-418 TaxID=2282169 RepID=A0A7C3KHY9_9CYAN|nr:hypothetical protein [Leptolyngbyaceae cyanobacterium M33_DOE_097]